MRDLSNHGHHQWQRDGEPVGSNERRWTSAAAAGYLAWNKDVTARGGAVTASAQASVTVKNGVAMDLSGTWQNDNALVHPPRDSNGQPTGEVNTKGGALRMYGNQVKVGNDVAMACPGGAWLNAAGGLSTGAGGSITLQATTFQNSLDASLQLGTQVRFEWGRYKQQWTGQRCHLGGWVGRIDRTQCIDRLRFDADRRRPGGLGPQR